MALLSSSGLPAGVRPISQTDGLPEIELWESQDDELFGCDDHYLVFVCGGRGSGKTKVNPLHLLRRGQLCTDQPYALCANTWDQLINAILPPIQEVFAEIGWEEGRDYVMGRQVPRAWRREWRRRGIKVPTIRLRNIKMLVCRNGLHIYLLTLANQSWRRIKGHEIQALFAEEMTEPDVPMAEFITYAVGSVRCGKGRDDECRKRGHLHQIFIKFNVPLHNPSHPVYRIVENYQTREKERAARGLKPFFRLIEAATSENKALPASFHENMRDALDPETYEEQTSGKLVRRSQDLTYYRFSEKNVLGMKEKNTAGPGLYYDPHAPLHVWFDFNTTPAVAGWGHDLRLDDVPPSDIKAGHEYFGVIGELFSDNDPMHTDQVAKALLEDPTAKTPLDGRCVESGCGHPIAKHMNMGARGFLCSVCEWKPEPGSKMFCSGQPIGYEFSRKYIHAPPNWRGLVKHRGKIFIYADASGEQEHAAAVKGPSLSILRKMFGEAIPSERLSFRTKKANPRIINRELAVNRSLRSQAGIHTLFIGAWCSAHIADLREVVPDPKTGTAKKVQWTEAAKKKGDEYPKRGHLLDALGYMVDYRWPFLMPKSGGLPAMAEAPDFGTLETDWPRV